MDTTAQDTIRYYLGTQYPVPGIYTMSEENLKLSKNSFRLHHQGNFRETCLVSMHFSTKVVVATRKLSGYSNILSIIQIL